MSKQGTSLANDPRVVIAVLVVLAVVIGLNVKAFLPEGNKPSAYSSEDAVGLAPPGDLMSVSQAVDAGTRSQAPNAIASGLAEARLGGTTRNPFEYLKNKRVSQARPAPRRRTRNPSPAPAVRPICSAIFVGNGTSSAIVSGRAVSVGDRLSNYRVQRITAQGVTLVAGGKETFLPLEQKRSGGGAVGAPVARSH